MYAKVIIKVKPFTGDVVSHGVVSGSCLRLAFNGSGRGLVEMRRMWFRELEQQECTHPERHLPRRRARH